MSPRAPPFDLWQWQQACHETWLAGFDRRCAVGLREQRLAQLIETAVGASPLYARRARHARTLADFEPIGKAELMHHFDDWATDRRITRGGATRALQSSAVADAWLDSYLLWSSSGTSGEPGIYVQDAASLAAYDAIDALRLRGSGLTEAALGPWGMGSCFAYVGALGDHYAGHVSIERLRRIAPPPWRPHIELLSVLDPLERTAARLQALQPDVLITYPTYAGALAQWQTRGALTLSLDELWLGGEQLTGPLRRALSEAFGCRLRNNYGASEFYSIACECDAGRLHLNDDWVLLEGVDARGRRVEPGEFSHLTLLTNLANRVQPLLRYELTDRVRFVGEPCCCGSALPVIEVQGRSDDVLELPGTGAHTVTVLPLALESVLEEDAGITQFQLLLRTDRSLELRLAGNDADRRRAFDRGRQALSAYLARQGARPVRVLQGTDEPRRQGGSGKLCRVIDLTRDRVRPVAQLPGRADSPQRPRGSEAKTPNR